MEFNDLLAYKPSLDLKASADDGDDSERVSSSKRKRDKEAAMDDIFKQPRVEDERARALRMMEEDTSVVETRFDLPSLRRLALTLERRITKNQQMRIKYSSDPTKFMDSEEELNEVIKEFATLATVPDLYPDFVKLGTLKSIVSLLHHENVDITASVVQLLQELSDGDALEDSEESATALIDALFEAQLLPFIIETLTRLKEPEDADTIHQTLGILENLLELNPELSTKIVQTCTIMPWLLKRLKGKKFDANKLYASEILAILLQNSDDNRISLAKQEGIGTLLKSISVYKRRDPATVEEYEMLENVFDILCSTLMLQANRNQFVAEEGLDLMIIMLRERKFSQHGALKVLDHAMGNPTSATACHTFIDRLGLKSLFPAFMKTPSSSKSKKLFSENDYEEHTNSIVAALITNLTLGDDYEQQVLRVLKKFVENDYVKVERLVELHLKYSAKVSACDAQISKDNERMEKNGQEIDDVMENEQFLNRLEAGLSTLQHVDIIIAEVCHQCGVKTRDRVAQLLNLKGSNIETVELTLKEYGENLQLNEDSEENRKRADRVEKLMLTLN